MGFVSVFPITDYNVEKSAIKKEKKLIFILFFVILHAWQIHTDCREYVRVTLAAAGQRPLPPQPEERRGRLVCVGPICRLWAGCIVGNCVIMRHVLPTVAGNDVSSLPVINCNATVKNVTLPHYSTRMFLSRAYNTHLFRILGFQSSQSQHLSNRQLLLKNIVSDVKKVASKSSFMG